LIYRSKNNYEKALEYYNKSLAIDRKYGNRLSEAINLQNIAVLYTKTNDTDKAMEFMMASNALSRKIDDQIGVLYTDHGIATIYFDRGDYDKSITALQTALLLAQKLNIKEEIKDLYESLALAYEKKNGFQRALEYRKKFEVAKDSLSGESFATRIKELEVKYESEKKDNELLCLQRKKNCKRLNRNARLFLRMPSSSVSCWSFCSLARLHIHCVKG
jgi:tetratricopeptide (TPR) repeat protein